MLIDVGEPSCYNEAIIVHDRCKWKHAMHRKLDSIHKIETRDSVPSPKGMKALPYKREYKYKYEADDALSMNKACIVAKGSKQEQGVDQ